MTNTNKNRPHVPGSSSGALGDDGSQARHGARGAKNPRVRSTHRQTTKAKKKDKENYLNIMTYNVRTLRTEEHLVELENALNDVKWDIIGLSEVRREGEDTIERQNNIFYHFGQTAGLYGVGFIVAKRWKDNILEFIAYSDRIALLKFKVSDTKTLTVIQVYAPTSAHQDEEVEDFYDLLNKACDDHRGTWNIIMGDFNAKIGQKQPLDNFSNLGPHGIGNRNERGTRLLQFSFGQNLYISNSFYPKKSQRRWTWVSPDGNTRNEIDFILTSHHQIVKNIQVLNQFKYTSDHRPIRATLFFDLKLYRKGVFMDKIKRLTKESLIINKQQFNLELKNNFSILDVKTEDVQEQYNNIANSVKTASRKIKTLPNKIKKLSSDTLLLIEERQALSANKRNPEYKNKNKEVKRNIRNDIRSFNTKLIQIALEKNRSLKIAKQGTTKGKQWINCLKDHSGQKHRSRDKILQICTNYFKSLYSNCQPSTSSINYFCPDTILPITGYEVHTALSKMKYNRVPGEDGISTEILKIGEPSLLPVITNMFNSILKTGIFPDGFCHSNIILLHKKGDKSDLNNYRPISLVSHLYKAFIKIIDNRISPQLEKHQPPQQAGFRSGLSTTDHLHAINQIVEKYQEFNIPIYLAFIDYSKAFDSLTHDAIFDALNNQEVDPTYISLLRKVYLNSTASIRLQTAGPSFFIEKGVKQGDPLSPKLFNSALEEVFKKLTASWERSGIEIGGTRLTNLRFADDIVVFSPTAAELELMLNQLSNASLEVGLAMNMSKTKLMSNTIKHRIRVNGEELQYVHEYIYLGQLVSFQSRQDKEVTRRTENAWKSYWSMKELMKGNLPLSLKRKIMDMCILPILTYGSQTWSLTNIQKSKLKVCQRAMERSILGVKLTDRVRNTTLRSKTQIADVAQKAAKLKWDWAGHVCRMPNELWAKITTFWSPDTTRRRRGRPRRRWRDELDRTNDQWPTLALDRNNWKSWGEAFAQQWDDAG